MSEIGYQRKTPAKWNTDEPVAEVIKQRAFEHYSDGLIIVPIKSMEESGLKAGDKLYVRPTYHIEKDPSAALQLARLRKLAKAVINEVEVKNTCWLVKTANKDLDALIAELEQK